MRILMLVLLWFPIYGSSQDVPVPEPEEGVNWEEIFKKAKADYKYVLVQIGEKDCEDCDLMKQEVYNNQDISTLLKESFLTVFIDKDSLRLFKSGDGKIIDLVTNYQILNVPTYLFFSPTGRVVHKGQWRKTVNDFYNLLYTASDRSAQYYTLLDDYESGKKDYPLLMYLALTARDLGDTSKANAIAADFKSNYLETLSDEALCKAAYINFIYQFISLLHSNDRCFKLFYEQQKLVDAEMYSGCAERFVLNTIGREINDKLWKDGRVITVNPDWEEIDRDVRMKYGKKYAERLLDEAKLSFYRRLENWTAFAQTKNEQIKKNPPKPVEGLDGDPWILNAQAWDVFLYCNEKPVLETALEWVGIAIALEPSNVQYYDTKANLLYKLGYVEEAIKWEGYAIQVGIVQAERKGRSKGLFFDDYNEVLRKMKHNEPTWPTK